MKKNVFIIILVIIVLGMGGYLVYDKVLSKDEVKKEKTETKEEIVEENKEETSDVYVLDGYNFASSGTFDEKYQPDENEKKMELMCNIKLPKITINSDNAKKFNDKIMSEQNPNNGCQKNFKGVGSSHIDYSYYVKDNIIFILITAQIVNHRGSGYNKHIGYYYDIANDKELSLDDIYKKYGITLDDVNKRIEIEKQNVSGLIEPVTKFDQTIMPTLTDGSYIVYLETTPGTYEIYIYK